MVAFNGVDDVALVFLGRDVFEAGRSGVSLLYAGSGVGLLLGFALIAARATRSPAVAVAIAGFAVSSTGNLLTGLSPAIAAAFAMQAVRGVGISLIVIGPTTLAAGVSYLVGGFLP